MRVPNVSPSTWRESGAEDVAIRRGQHYGTLIIDCETGAPLDLLEGRDAQPLTAGPPAPGRGPRPAGDRPGTWAGDCTPSSATTSPEPGRSSPKTAGPPTGPASSTRSSPTPTSTPTAATAASPACSTRTGPSATTAATPWSATTSTVSAPPRPRSGRHRPPSARSRTGSAASPAPWPRTSSSASRHPGPLPRTAGRPRPGPRLRRHAHPTHRPRSPAVDRRRRDVGLPGIASFARGLEHDLDAVTAGLILPWSSGPVEGRVNHIKAVSSSRGHFSPRLSRNRT